MRRPAADAALLQARLAAYAAAVDDFLARRLDALPGPPALANMLRYHLGWVDERFQPAPHAGGKRIRPALCLLACEAAGGDWRAAVPSAAAVELVHNFSLIHDDIEDESPLRRHRPTVWSLWGVPLAINLGDALFAEAQLAVLAQEGPPARTLAAAELLGQACRALCAGQHRDLAPAAALPSLDDYYAMIGGKTAALLAAAAELGGLAAAAPPAARAAYAAFGRELGLAFQVQDDLLDVWGASERRGKAAREDVRTAKHSFPWAAAFDRADPAQRAALAALRARAPLDDAAVAEVVALFEQLGVREEGERRVAAHHTAALDALAAADPMEPGGGLLRALAEALLGRDF
ncbi:MAG TPA: polyprenyl synthetase family protein [Chloroflexota bacterium]|jgi:geranylgeranyl diphosphate synthase type I|nr:polyprenyl synthetase family protein [Chloroflexota bacterium]